jgi:hypothetical protein
MALSKHHVAIPAGTSKVAQKTTVFPVSFPRLPASAFPISSHEDLVDKLSKLFLRRSSSSGKTGGRTSVKHPGKGK